MPIDISNVFLGKISPHLADFKKVINDGLSFFEEKLLKLKTKSNVIILKPNILPTEFRNEGLPVTNPILCAAVADFLLDIGFTKVILTEGTTNNRKGEANTIEAMENNGFSNFSEKWEQFDMNKDEVGKWFEIYSPGDEGDPKNPFDIELGISKLALTYPIISCAKFKTHDVLGLTLSVKNLMGCLSKARRKSTGEILHVGPLVKAYMHGYGPKNPYFIKKELNYGPSKTSLAININRMARNIFPAFSVIDAAPAMEGNGPIRGTPKPLDLILFSNDPVAVDSIACKIAGIDLEYNQYIKNFERINLGIANLEKIQLFNEHGLINEIQDNQFIYHEWFHYSHFTKAEIELLKELTK